MEKETCIVLILKRAVPLEYVLCWLLKYIKEPKWLILYLCENGFWSRAESNGSAVRMIPALSVNMRLLCFLTQISRGPLCACVCVCGRGRTCICAYMCAEWEQGHSWGLGFLSEKKKENVFKPFYPSHCKTSALPQLCVGLALTSCFTIGLLPLRLLLPLFTICCLSHVYRLIPPWLRLSWTPGRSQQKLTGLLTSISGPLHSCLHS